LQSVVTSGNILSAWSLAAASRAKQVMTLSKSSPISLNPPAQRGMYDLLSKEVSLSDLKWTYHRTRAIPDHICRKFPVNLSELRPI